MVLTASSRYRPSLEQVRQAALHIVRHYCRQWPTMAAGMGQASLRCLSPQRRRSTLVGQEAGPRPGSPSPSPMGATAALREYVTKTGTLTTRDPNDPGVRTLDHEDPGP